MGFAYRETSRLTASGHQWFKPGMTKRRFRRRRACKHAPLAGFDPRITLQPTRHGRQQITGATKMSRRTAFMAATAVAALVVGSLPADAAMPVSDAAQVTAGSDTVLAQGGQKKKSKRQREIDSSVDSGTVPKRYRSSVPKQYHHLIPFAK
jgi:hypothetical protein